MSAWIWLAVNVCLNLIGCFEVVPLVTTPTAILVRLTRVFPLLLFFSTSRRLSLAPCFCFATLVYSPSTLGSFFLSKVAFIFGWASLLYRVFIVICWNKPTAGYLWFWYAAPFKRKLSLWCIGGNIGLFGRQRSENVVKAYVGSTEENTSWKRKIFISKRRKRWSTRSSLKEIVTFVFNKSTQETRRIRLSRLILPKKETPRRRINPKNWLRKELWHKIPKKGILSLTKVKVIVGDWQHCFEQVRRYISLRPSFFWGVIILSLLECKLFLLSYLIFSISIGKNMQSWISLEINYFVGIGCFLFLRNIDTLFFQVAKVSFPSPFFISFIFILLYIPLLGLTVTVR